MVGRRMLNPLIHKISVIKSQIFAIIVSHEPQLSEKHFHHRRMDQRQYYLLSCEREVQQLDRQQSSYCALVIWSGILLCFSLVPILAANSPSLAWRPLQT